jgi:hypothetical protein
VPCSPIVGLAVVFYFLHQMHGRMGNAAERGTSAARPPEPAGTERTTGDGPGWGVLLLLTLILMLPLMLLHSVIPAGSPIHAVLFWIALLLPLLILPFMLPTRRAPGAAGPAGGAEALGEAREAEWRRQRLELVGPARRLHRARAGDRGNAVRGRAHRVRGAAPG